jgi:hypothetical protein
LVQPGGVYIGISGGLSDFVVPNMGAMSMIQSALRTLYSVAAQEAQDSKTPSAHAQVRMLASYGLVATDGSSGQDGRWMAAPQIGVRVGEIIARPGGVSRGAAADQCKEVFVTLAVRTIDPNSFSPLFRSVQGRNDRISMDWT